MKLVLDSFDILLSLYSVLALVELLGTKDVNDLLLGMLQHLAGARIHLKYEKTCTKPLAIAIQHIPIT
jgi:hypothetical protein